MQSLKERKVNFSPVTTAVKKPTEKEVSNVQEVSDGESSSEEEFYSNETEQAPLTLEPRRALHETGSAVSHQRRSATVSTQSIIEERSVRRTVISRESTLVDRSVQYSFQEEELVDQAEERSATPISQREEIPAENEKMDSNAAVAVDVIIESDEESVEDVHEQADSVKRDQEAEKAQLETITDGEKAEEAATVCVTQEIHVDIPEIVSTDKPRRSTAREATPDREVRCSDSLVKIERIQSTFAVCDLK